MSKHIQTLLFCSLLVFTALGDPIQGSLQVAVPNTSLKTLEDQIIHGVTEALSNKQLPDLNYKSDLPLGFVLAASFTNVYINLISLDANKSSIGYESDPIPQIVFSGKDSLIGFKGSYNITIPLLGTYAGNFSLKWSQISAVAAVGLGRIVDRLDLIFNMKQLDAGEIVLKSGRFWLDLILSVVVDWNLWLFNDPLKDQITQTFNNIIEDMEKDIPTQIEVYDNTTIGFGFNQDPFLTENNNVLVVGVSAVLYQNSDPLPVINVTNVTYDYSNIQGVRIMCHHDLLENIVSTIVKIIPINFDLRGDSLEEFLGLRFDTDTFSSFIPEYRNVTPNQYVDINATVSDQNTSVSFNAAENSMTLQVVADIAISMFNDSTENYTGSTLGTASVTISTVPLVDEGFVLFMNDIELLSFNPENPNWNTQALLEFGSFAVQIGIDYANQIFVGYPLQKELIEWQNWVRIQFDNPQLKFREDYAIADCTINVFPIDLPRPSIHTIGQSLKAMFKDLAHMNVSRIIPSTQKPVIAKLLKKL
eukprot:CAMPEP_0176460966 /NCGR_PEP_ID=MMETSP0127-20121128/34347_1 /TAXON_ID=938130 /ORGANISM="Platyophrya macrostoma, Strain WH" /LENGTH=531 /DNA_ID=CAMNT_0017852515 /DNA_START=27 /DNA_END=1622 /DNA_ORIENTATION=-